MPAQCSIVAALAHCEALDATFCASHCAGFDVHSINKFCDGRNTRTMDAIPGFTLCTDPVVLHTFNFNVRPISCEGAARAAVRWRTGVTPHEDQPPPNIIVHWFKLDFGTGPRSGQDTFDTSPTSDVRCWKQGIAWLKPQERPQLSADCPEAILCVQFAFDRMSFSGQWHVTS